MLSRDQLLTSQISIWTLKIKWDSKYIDVGRRGEELTGEAEREKINKGEIRK